MAVRKQNAWKRIELVLFLSVILFGLLAVLSAAMTPGWHVTAYADHLKVSSDSTSIKAKDLETTPEGTYKVKTTTITMAISGGQHAMAIVREPIGAPSGRPACVFVHGAGTGKASEVYEDLANAMASAGITTLVQDKRLDNYTALSRDYLSNAVDYTVGLDTLRGWDGVDSSKVGVYAESEGTWISTVMTKQDPDIAFSILTSPPVVSGRSQMAMAATSYLNIIGAPSGVQGIIPKFTSMNFGWLGLNYADFDTGEYLDSLTMPVLVNYGTLDPAMPVEQGARMIMSAAAADGNNNVTVRYYPTNHQMRVGSALSLPGLQLESHYTTNLEDWINAVAAGTTADDWATPMVAGDQPYQEYAAPEASEMKPGLVSNVNAIFIVAGLGLLAWLVAVVTSFVLVGVNHGRARRLRRAEASGDANAAATLRKPRRFTGGTGLLISLNLVMTAVMLAGCGGYIVMTAKAALSLTDEATALHAGWLALQILFLGAIVLFAWMWDRIIVNKTRFRFRGEPAHEPMKMMPGHWVVIVATTLCVLAMFFLCTFLGLMIV
ncbi:alpha/beta hydrolase family protein [Bifidobacterium choloepi]|uniref:Alpha/beta hydrolase n=1 Tax=Bifidobacterium choloepi TaxID=2614131 RepID=A0A6I5NAY3_9BIFI|nr:hypothetical protein [Bifidobacterium choloepi]NEG69610.1 hypothetical protein [Bifidobacterium choloepi]